MAEPTQVFVASELLSENEQTELKDLFLKFDGDHNGRKPLIATHHTSHITHVPHITHGPHIMTTHGPHIS